MKKLVFSFFSTFFLLIFIWTIIGFMTFGPDIVNKHFDFKSTIQNLTGIFSWKGPDLIGVLEELKDAFTFNSGNFGQDLLKFFKFFLKPFEIILDLLKMFFDVIISIFKFIFQPKFF